LETIGDVVCECMRRNGFNRGYGWGWMCFQVPCLAGE
jgi:hypothetical protein